MPLATLLLLAAVIAPSDALSVRVVGRAVDDSGTPLAGLRVELADFGNGEPWMSRPSTLTDHDGRFALDVEELSERTIVSAWQDATTLLWSRVIRWRASGVDDVGDLMIEHHEPWLEGWVVDDRGAAVEGAEVVAYHRAGRVFARTAADGSFQIGGLFPYDVAVAARSTTHRTSHSVDVVERDGRIVAPTLVLDVLRTPEDDTPHRRHRRPADEGLDDPDLVAARKEGRTLGFVVLSHEDAPVPEATIALFWSKAPRRDLAGRSPPEKWYRLADATADAEGRARIDGVPPGHAWIEAVAVGRPAIFRDLVVSSSGGIDPIRLAFERGSFLEGFVTENGKRRDRIDGYRRLGFVEIGGPHTFGTYRVPLEFDGSFRGGPLPAGTYSIRYVDEVPIRSVEVWEGATRLSTIDTDFLPFLPLAEGVTASLELRIVARGR